MCHLKSKFSPIFHENYSVTTTLSVIWLRRWIAGDFSVTVEISDDVGNRTRPYIDARYTVGQGGRRKPGGFPFDLAAQLGFALGNFCLTQLRRYLMPREALGAALHLAEATGWIAYEASYLWLSSGPGGELAMLGDKLTASAAR